jgi:hypothetical protein
VIAFAGLLLGVFAGSGGSAVTTDATTLTESVTETVTTEQTTTEVTTATETETTTETETATIPAIAPPPAAEEEANNSAWAWLALAAALFLALVGGVVFWVHRRRARAGTWSSQLSDLARRSLVAMDEVVREGSVVTGKVQALAAEAQSLEQRAPDDDGTRHAGLLRERLDELASTLSGDRALRLSSPAPTEEQLSYSSALIRQQVTELQGLLRPPVDPPA